MFLGFVPKKIFVSLSTLSSLFLSPAPASSHPAPPPLTTFFVYYAGEKTIDFSSVNDDYCDCTDGSDEPGTSACGSTLFYCANEASAPLSIPSYRVNDGVCDCCDATDEYDGAAGCTNICAEHGRALREANAKARLVAAAGYKLRQTNMAEGTARRAELEGQIEGLKAQQAAFQSRVDAADAVKAAAEVPETAAKTVFDDQWDVTLAARKEAAVGALFSKIDADKSGTIELSEVEARVEFDADEDGTVSVEEATTVLDVDSDNVLSDEEGACTLASFTEEIFDDAKEKFEDIVVDDNKPEYDDATKALIATADEARNAKTAIETEKKGVDGDLSKIEADLKHDWGANNEFAYMIGECFEVQVTEYTYKVCPFDNAKQGHTSLGNFEGFVGKKGNKYTQMKFGGGQKCWNGPARSMTVDLVCGEETTPTNVQEPSKCEYSMTMSTPALCDEPIAGHDEL